MIRPAAIVCTSLLSVCCATKPAPHVAAGPLLYPRPVIDCTKPWPSDAAPCRAVAEAENRNVWISSTTAGVVHYCSGVIISTGHVLTAGHCVGELISIDGVVAGVLKIDHIADLMLLNTKTADFEPVVINSEPVISEPVYTAANHEPRMGIFTMARIVWLDQDEVCAQTLAAPGVSGSAIYDSSGRLVTIAQQAQASHFDTGTPSVMFSIGVHPKKIAAFLGANP